MVERRDRSRKRIGAATISNKMLAWGQNLTDVSDRRRFVAIALGGDRFMPTPGRLLSDSAHGICRSLFRF
jgi:hypothetical protein